ncbi:hypothetical protein FQ021_28180, partial [Escherichia coli]|nr:hypothetical protein [Escherichia coli]
MRAKHHDRHPPDIAGYGIRKSPCSDNTPFSLFTDTADHAHPGHSFFIYLNVIRRLPMGLDVYFIKRPADTTAA